MPDRAAFFGSIHGALNHILVGDRVWLARLEHSPTSITALDERPYLAALRAARIAEDAHIEAVVDEFDAAALLGDLHYRNMAGEDQSTPLAMVLAHMFNHQTHHRGQVHDMLSQTDVAPPPLDLIYFLRQR